MKIAIILALVGVAVAASPRISPKADTSLESAFKKITAVFHLDQLEALLATFPGRAGGADFMAYFQTAEFLAAVDTVHKEKAYTTLTDYTKERGAPVKEYIETILRLLGVEPPKARISRATITEIDPDFAELVRLIGECIDDNILEIVLELLSTDNAFIDLLLFVGTEEINGGYCNLKYHDNIQAVVKHLIEKGIDYEALKTTIALVETILGLACKEP